MRRLSLHPLWALAAVGLGCFGLGVAGGRAWEDYLDYSRRRRWAEQERRSPGARWQAIRRADSIASTRRDTSVRPMRTPPRELRRVQAGLHCAYTMLVVDSTPMPLFNVGATDVRTGDVIGQGWAFREGGFGAGDTVTVVAPYTECSSAVILGMGWGAVFPTRRERIGIDVR